MWTPLVVGHLHTPFGIHPNTLTWHLPCPLSRCRYRLRTFLVAWTIS
jgi:hypothetical protein